MKSLVLCALLCLCAVGGTLGSDAAKQPATLGQPAPSFALPNVLTGAQASLATLEKGRKAIVVMFVSTRCPVSNAYNDRMIDLAVKYGARGVVFVGIDSNQTEPHPEVAGFVKDHKFPFPVLKDDGSSVADAYAARCTPETYLINAKGVLEYHGRIDNSADTSQVDTHDLANALDEVLAGKPVSKPETKAFGCAIKR